ncbi:hypothetical protein GEMRC1_002459 [Eukaryota sp. GEM-RC1]
MTLKAPLSASYTDQYRRRRLHLTDPTATTLITDRSAYLSFLENQLDRTTASCLTVDSFSDRLNDFTRRFASLESRLSSYSQSISSCRKEQEEFCAFRMNAEEAFARINHRLDKLELSMNKHQENIPVISSLSKDMEFVKAQAQKLDSKADKSEVTVVSLHLDRFKTEFSKLTAEMCLLQNFEQFQSQIDGKLKSMSETLNKSDAKLRSSEFSFQDQMDQLKSITDELKNENKSTIRFRNSTRETLETVFDNVSSLTDSFMPIVAKNSDEVGKVKKNIDCLEKSLDQCNRRTAYMDSQISIKINSLISQINQFFDTVALLENKVQYVQESVHSQV